MDFRFQSGGELLAVQIEKVGEGYRVVAGGREYTVEILRGGAGEVAFRVDGRPVVAHVASDGQRLWVAAGGQTLVLSKPAAKVRGRLAGQSGDRPEALMPGLVRSVAVAEGQEVRKGQTLVVLEAMKMELRVTAPHDGRVRLVLVREGDVVERGQVLVEVLPAEG